MSANSFTIRVQKSFLQGTGYRFSILRLPRASFVVQKANIPGLSLPSPNAATPFVNEPMAGDHLLYDELRISFKVDEDLTNYLEIHNWIRGLGFPDEFKNYADLEIQSGTGFPCSDALLVILDAKKRPSISVSFRECVPISLSELQFDATTPDLEFLGAEAMFKYTSFSIKTS